MTKFRTIIFAVYLCFALSLEVSWGMPTDAELEKAKPIIHSLTADDFAALKAGKKKRAELAEELLGYVVRADTEAARFQLIKLAFNLFMQEGDCANASAAFVKLREGVKDVPDGLFGTWAAGFVPGLAKAGNADGAAILLESALDASDMQSVTAIAQRVRVSFPRQTGRLAAVYARTVEFARRQKELSGLQAALKKAVAENKPTAALRERYGTALAAAGDWNDALDEFAQGVGELAEIAELERSPNRQIDDARRIAEFWWERSETMKGDSAKAFREHSAKWYRISIANGVLSGLNKTLAEKRIAETERTVVVSANASNVPTAAVSAGKTGTPILIKMGKGVVMEFMPIPAGTFTMGYKSSPNYCHYPHQVTITRSFWIGKFPVTIEQWEQTGRQANWEHRSLKNILGGIKLPVSSPGLTRDDASRFADELSAKYAKILPSGYIFRLPTMAEREYACRANGNPDLDWYAKPRLTEDEYQKYCWTCEERVRFAKTKAKGVDFAPNNLLVKFWGVNFPPVAVGMKPGNAWGIYDIRGNVHEFLLDTFSTDISLDIDHNTRMFMTTMNTKWEGMDTDPLFWNDSPNAHTAIAWNLWAGDYQDEISIAARDFNRGRNCGFRLVIGPDLVKEKKSR